jgi:LacI family transcriptional regulator
LDKPAGPNRTRTTLARIAREAGVSPATVDRVLNQRDGVKPHTRAHVIAVAQNLGYLVGAVAQGRPLRLAYLLPAGTNAFIRQLRDQIETQAAALTGVETRVETIRGFDPLALAARLGSLKGQADGVGLIALDHPVVREAIRALAAAGVRIVTLASDIQNVPRVAYIGTDNRQAGRLAGYVMGRFLHAPQGKVALFAGSLSYRGHQEREMGFRQILHEEFPRLQIVELREVLDDREKAFREALALFDLHPDLAAIYNVGGGTAGIARALKDRGLAGRLVLIAHDATEGNKALLLEGTLDAIIDQNARVEARESLAALIHAVRGQPYTVIPPRLQIILRENLPDE